MNSQTISYESKESGFRTVNIFSSSEQISNEIADRIVKLSAASIKDHGVFNIVFSGGSLPKLVGSGLTQSHIASEIHWSGWRIFYADERCVEINSKDSNHAELQKHLLSKLKQAIPDKHVWTINNKLIHNPKAAALDYQDTILSELDSDLPKFDLILLGMGPDGHCCSLFPNHPLLFERDRLVMEIVDSPKPPPERITFTLPLVNAAHHCWFVITGQEKAESFKSVIEKPEEGLPSARVKGSDLQFFVDSPAATALKLSKL